MKKNLIPMPKSKFVRLVCKKCKTEHVVFSKSAHLVKCSCGEEIVIPTGGQAFINGKILETFG